MIRALISGELINTPQERTSRNGKPFALARVSVPQADEGRLFCSVIAFQADAVARLLQLKAGASVALAGTLKISTWTTRDGATKPADMTADEVASTTPRPRKRKDEPASQPGGDPFAGLPGAGDVDWTGA